LSSCWLASEDSDVGQEPHAGQLVEDLAGELHQVEGPADVGQLVEAFAKIHANKFLSSWSRTCRLANPDQLQHNSPRPTSAGWSRPRPGAGQLSNAVWHTSLCRAAGAGLGQLVEVSGADRHQVEAKADVLDLAEAEAIAGQLAEDLAGLTRSAGQALKGLPKGSPILEARRGQGWPIPLTDGSWATMTDRWPSLGLFPGPKMTAQVIVQQHLMAWASVFQQTNQTNQTPRRSGSLKQPMFLERNQRNC
jgi:hypothetical protein